MQLHDPRPVPAPLPGRSRVGRPGRVLVVGGGFLGSHMTAGFLARDVPTTNLTRHEPAGDGRSRITGARIVTGDAGTPESIESALEGVDHVVWSAGGLLPADSDHRKIDDVSSALPPLLMFLDALVERRDVSLTLLSSGGTVYGNPTVLPVPEHHALRPISAHGVTKIASELYLGLYREVHGVHTVALRCGNVYGPGQRANRSQGVVATALARAATGERLSVFGDGSAVRDYVYVDDVVDVVCRLATRRDVPEVVNVGSGGGTSLNELLRVIHSVTGVDLPVEYRPARPGDARSVVLDTTLLRSLIAYAPIPIEEGIARTWDEVSGIPRRAAQ